MRMERPAIRYVLRERLARNVCHREEHKPADLIHREDRHDTGVCQPGNGARLAQEPPAAHVVEREVGGEDLDRHPPVQPSLAREIDVRHPPAPNGRLDVVETVQCGLQLFHHGAIHYPTSVWRFALDTCAIRCRLCRL